MGEPCCGGMFSVGIQASVLQNFSSKFADSKFLVSLAHHAAG